MISDAQHQDPISASLAESSDIVNGERNGKYHQEDIRNVPQRAVQ